MQQVQAGNPIETYFPMIGRGLLVLVMLLCGASSTLAVDPLTAAAGVAAAGTNGLRGGYSRARAAPAYVPSQDAKTSGEGKRHVQDLMAELLLQVRALVTAPGLSNATLAAHPAAGRQLLDIQTAAAALLSAAGAAGEGPEGGTVRLAAIAADPLFAAHFAALFPDHVARRPRPTKGTRPKAQGSADGGPELSSAAAASSAGSARVVSAAPAVDSHRSSLTTDTPAVRNLPAVSQPTTAEDTRVPVQLGEAGRQQRRRLQKNVQGGPELAAAAAAAAARGERVLTLDDGMEQLGQPRNGRKRDEFPGALHVHVQTPARVRV